MGLQLSLPAVSRVLAVASACLVVLLGACGGKDEPKPTATPNAEVTAAATADSGLDGNKCERAEDPGKQTRKKLDKPTERLDDAHTYIATGKTNCGAFEIPPHPK